MLPSSIRFTSYPRTKPPPGFAFQLAAMLRAHEDQIGTVQLPKGLTSDEVLAVIRTDLVTLGFEVEVSKRKGDKIQRPVCYGEDGKPTLKYEVDAYHPEWRCGLEIEAGRALMGNAIYRDLIQALVMVEVDILILAVPNEYKYSSIGRMTISNDYEKTISIAETLFGHSRIRFPYDLVVFGY